MQCQLLIIAPLLAILEEKKIFFSEGQVDNRFMMCQAVIDSYIEKKNLLEPALIENKIHFFVHFCMAHCSRHGD